MHRAEILVSNTYNHNTDRQSRGANNCGDGLAYIANFSIRDDGQDGVAKVALASSLINRLAAFCDDRGEVSWA